MSESSSETNETEVEQDTPVDLDLANAVGPELSPIEAHQDDVSE